MIPGDAAISALGGGVEGFFASGEDEDGALGVWRSADGTSWRRVSVEGSGHIAAFSLEGTPSVAVGCTECSSDGDPFAAAVWTSTAGDSWRLVELPEEAAKIDDVVAWRDRYVAGGAIELDSGTGAHRIAVWRSDDGTSWRPTVALNGHGRSAELAMTSDAVFLVSSQSIWRSTDGRTWSMVGPAPASEDPKFWLTTTAGGPGLVALWSRCVDSDSGEACRVVVTTSTDGSSWTTAPEQPALGDWSVRDVTRFGDLLVAVGGAGDYGIPVVATSRDGLSWQREDLSIEPVGGLLGVAISNSRIVAIAYNGDVWIGAPR